jgi:hypothetical protein
MSQQAPSPMREADAPSTGRIVNATLMHPTHRDPTMTPLDPPRMSQMAHLSPVLGNRCRLARLSWMSELLRTP